MKKIIVLLRYLTLCLFSFNAYAYGPGITLLSSKIEMSKDVQGGFSETSTPINLTANGGAKAYAKASAAHGKKGENIRITGSHGYVIENRSGHMQQYMIEYKIMTNDGSFIRKSDVVLVQDKAVERGTAASYMTRYYPAQGTYLFSVDTSVRGDYSDYSRDSSNVYVN